MEGIGNVTRRNVLHRVRVSLVVDRSCFVHESMECMGPMLRAASWKVVEIV